jgi:hypothetical protein
MGNLRLGGCPFFLRLTMRIAIARSDLFRFLNPGIKLLVLTLLGCFLYLELRSNGNLPHIWAAFCQQMDGVAVTWLLAAILLMPLNWLAETQKWLPFIRRYEPMSRWRALQAILSGVTISLFTPNRIGDLGGRLLFVRPENHWHSVAINLAGSVAQLLVLCTFGAIGAIWLIQGFAQGRPEYLSLVVVFALAGLGLMYWAYFNFKAIAALICKIHLLRCLKRYVKDLDTLQGFTRSDLGDILRWAAIRAVIYATQYFFLLNFFGIEINPLEGYASIFCLFLLQSSIPLPPLTGLLLRGNLAVQLWGLFGANEIISLAATFVLWIINLIFPALVGTFSILFVNITKTFAHENQHS